MTLLVSDIVSSVRPWNARSNAITAGRPVAARAILTAFSTRLGARVQQHALVLAAAGIELGQPPADLDVGLVHADHEALVQVAVDLRVDRLDDVRRAVPEVLAADAAGEVDVGAPVVGLDPGAGGAGDDERRGRHGGGDVAVARLADAGGVAVVMPLKAGPRAPAGNCAGGESARGLRQRTAATPHQSAMKSAIACAVRRDRRQVDALVDAVLALRDRAEADRGRVAVEVERARVGRRGRGEQRRRLPGHARGGVGQAGDQRRVGGELVALALEALVEHLDAVAARARAVAATAATVCSTRSLSVSTRSPG